MAKYLEIDRHYETMDPDADLFYRTDQDYLKMFLSRFGVTIKVGGKDYRIKLSFTEQQVDGFFPAVVAMAPPTDWDSQLLDLHLRQKKVMYELEELLKKEKKS